MFKKELRNYQNFRSCGSFIILKTKIRFVILAIKKLWIV